MSEELIALSNRVLSLIQSYRQRPTLWLRLDLLTAMERFKKALEESK
jgi:hypothetical protein